MIVTVCNSIDIYIKLTLNSKEKGLEVNKYTNILERKAVPEPILPEDMLSDEEIDEIARGGDELNNDVLLTVEKLGYVPPTITKRREEAKAEAETIRQKQEMSKRTLAHVLGAVGIQPFTLESVEKYQKKMLRSKFQILDNKLSGWQFVAVCFLLNSISCGIIATFITASYSGLWAVFLPFVAIILLAVSDGSKFLSYTIGRDTTEFIFIFLVTGITYIPIYFFMGLSLKVWQEVPLTDYPEDIPHHALEKIAEINPRIPEATFSVCHLTKNPDPFLVVSLGEDERYYIDVWNEPKYRPS